jgi:hypothetical protein
MSLFVNILGNAPGYDHDAQRLVRSHVMKNFRRREREAAREKLKAASGATANMSCDPGKSQFIRLDHAGHSTREPRDQISGSSTPPDSILDASQIPKACDKPGSIPQHVCKSSKPCNEERKPERKDISNTCLPASAGPTSTAHKYEMHLTEDIGSTLRSPEAYRQQLMLPFLELHYSPAMPNLHLAFPKMQARLKPLRPGILTLATDAVLLHALSVSQKDDSLLWAARRKNNEAIAGLRMLLSTSRNCASDEVLLTTDALAFFDAGSSTSWRHHANGLAALITTRGPSIYDSIGLLLHAPVLQLLMDALVWHGPFVFGEARWLSAMLPTCQTRMSRLICLGCRVPDIVKRMDNYLAQDERASADFNTLMDSIARLELSLQKWLWDWYLEEFQKKPPYTTNAHTEPLNFGLSASLDPPPFHHPYTFPSLREAFAHNIFWTLLLTLRQAHYQLHASSPLSTTAAKAAHQTAASETADSILRSAPFILPAVTRLPSGLACSAGPLIVAARWFAVSGEEGKERRKWCESTVDVLTEGGERPAGWITRSCAAWITAVL